MSEINFFFSVSEINFFPQETFPLSPFFFSRHSYLYEGIFSNHKTRRMLSIYVKYLNWINDLHFQYNQLWLLNIKSVQVAVNNVQDIMTQ